MYCSIKVQYNLLVKVLVSWLVNSAYVKMYCSIKVQYNFLVKVLLVGCLFSYLVI